MEKHHEMGIWWKLHRNMYIYMNIIWCMI
jgi:hypothetical protein